jgi:hypothetical protein
VVEVAGEASVVETWELEPLVVEDERDDDEADGLWAEQPARATRPPKAIINDSERTTGRAIDVTDPPGSFKS